MDKKPVHLNQVPNYPAPDGSMIHLLATGSKGGMCVAMLPPGKCSQAHSHRTVEEIWYIVEGEGEVWRGGLDSEPITAQPGMSLVIPVGTAFQFRNLGQTPLKILIATMPPWPGTDKAVDEEVEEAVPETGIW